MKIIDFEQKGNVVRFYLGDDSCEDFWGDDWDDYPYECNAGQVYERFVSGYADVSFPFDNLVLQPCSGAYNSEFSKEDMKQRKVPCLIVVSPFICRDTWDTDNFQKWVGAKGVKKYYFGDKWKGRYIKLEEKND